MRLALLLIGLGGLIASVVGCAADPSADGVASAPAPELAKQEQELSLLCGSSAQCNDGNDCTLDLCLLGVCIHGPDLGCCQQDSDCHTDAVCSVVSCVLNTCIESPLLGCGDMSGEGSTDEQISVLCGSDNDCVDSDPCTDNICLLGGVCLFTPNPLCCDEDSDCSGLVACHDGECTNNRCALTLLPLCMSPDTDETAPPGYDGGTINVLCGSDDDCEDGDPCTDDVCLVGGACVFSANPLCCDEASDCDGLLACHTGECLNDRCSLTPISGCTQSDAGEAATGPSSSGVDTGAVNNSSAHTEPSTTDGATSDTQGTTVAPPSATEPDSATSDTQGTTVAPPLATEQGSTSAEATSSFVTNDDVASAASSAGTNTVAPWNSWATPFTGASGSDGVTAEATSTSHDSGDDVTVDDGDGRPRAPSMTSELTGGACSLVAVGVGARPGYWLVLGLVACVAWRRRK